MEIDNFKEMTIKTYKEEISEIYTESEYESNFDVGDFNAKLVYTWNSAKLDGISEGEFFEIVQECMPEQIDLIIFPFDNLPMAA